MVCPQCGAPTSEQVYHCAHCGAPLQAAQPFGATNHAGTSDDDTSPKPPRRGYGPGEPDRGRPARPLPSPVAAETAALRPDSNLIPAILATVLCSTCFPLGIVAIIFAAQVDGKFNAGDYEGAQGAADKARLFTILTVAASVLLFVVLFVAGFVSGFRTEIEMPSPG